MQNEERAQLHRLLRGRRWAALATLCDNGWPHVSFIAYAAEPDFSGFLFHLSRLAPHTRHLLSRPQASLGISEPETAADDPQRLGRVTLQGEVQAISRGSAEYAAARACYLAHLPESERLFSFEDFVLFRLRPAEARFVGGFARTHALRAEQLREIACG